MIRRLVSFIRWLFVNDHNGHKCMHLYKTVSLNRKVCEKCGEEIWQTWD